MQNKYHTLLYRQLFSGKLQKVPVKFLYKSNITFHKEGKRVELYALKEFININNLYRTHKYLYIRNPNSNFRNLLIKLMEQS